MIDRTIFFLCILLLAGTGISAQENDQDKLPGFYPGISSSIPGKLQLEFGLYSSFLMTDHLYGNVPKPSGEAGIRKFEGNLNFLSNLFQVTCGLGRNLAIGLDLNRSDSFYSFDDDLPDTTFHSWRAGPRIRWAVFNHPRANLVIQHYLLLPLNADPSGNPYNDLSFGNQVILSSKIGDRFLMTNQLDIVLFRKTDFESKMPVFLPYTLFFSYLLNTETMLFTLFQYQAEMGEVAWDPDSYYNRRSSAAIGVGAQIRVARNLSLNGYINRSFYTTYQGALTSFSLGIRYGTN